jgi:AcrR family transcriptional regulator
MNQERDENATPVGGTRERILEAATRIIEERGVGALRIREVARAAGIREGSIYNHFKGRDEIVRAIFSAVDSSMSPFGAILNIESTPREQMELVAEAIRGGGFGEFLRQSGEYLIAHFTAHPGYLPVIRALFGARFHDEGAHAIYRDVFLKDMTTVCLAICRTAADVGALKSGIDPARLTELVSTAFEHAIGESYGADGFERFSASLKLMLGLIGDLAGI